MTQTEVAGTAGDRQAQGRACKAQLFGEKKVQSGRGAADELVPELGGMIDEVLWAGVWSRPGLPLKTRSMCTLSALLARQNMDTFRVHAYGARRLGATREEITEMVVQVGFYIGLPVMHQGLKIVRDVYADPDPDEPSKLSVGMADG